MISRKIFKKKNSKIKILFLFLFLSIILIFLIYFIFLKKEDKIIVISENINNFYIIPKDRGGEKVQNLDKKSLNLNKKNFDIKNHDEHENLLFSIQFYVDSDIEKVNEFLIKIMSSAENIYDINDFYILGLNSGIGIDYFLLYKNFTNRLDAQSFCINFLTKIDNCLIVDTTKF